MSKLLFHRVGLAEISPFDEAITSIAKGSHVKIVSPYIGLGYFQRLIALSPGWRLITDIEAWLSSLESQERMRSTQFIQNNYERIHHFRDIHAKTVIGCSTAYLGSANLTSKGIQARTEMGILVDELEMIADLNSWFDELWQATSIPVMAEVLAYSHGIDSDSREKTPRVALKPLSFDGERVHARLVGLPNANTDLIIHPLVNQSSPIERNTQRDIVEVSQVTEAPSQLEKENFQALPTQLPMEEESELQTEVEKIVFPSPMAEDYLSENLEDAVSFLVEKLANSGFTFKEFVGRIRRGRGTFRICAVYLELALYCGNIPRSVFSPEITNRLIYTNGLFRQSTKFEATLSLVQYDVFLAKLIEVLSFESTMSIQDCLDSYLSSRRVWVCHWLCDLKQSGLLIECNRATKDFLGSYQLNEKFLWTRRWQLFEKACQAWDVKLKFYRDLVSLPSVVTGDGERGGEGGDMVEGHDKSDIYPQLVPTLSHGLERSVYARTPMEKGLPPNIATTVSFGNKIKTPKQEEDVNLMKYRADYVYCGLFEILYRAKESAVIGMRYSSLVYLLARKLKMEAGFVFRVIGGNIPYLPVAAKVQDFNGECHVSILRGEVLAYPKASEFLREKFEKRERKIPQASKNEKSKSKFKIQNRPTLSIKSILSTAPENKLIAHRLSEIDSVASSDVGKRDEIDIYMQRVASIFK